MTEFVFLGELSL